MSKSQKIFLIDAMALIYRAYFAFIKSPRINNKGMNTSTVLGFANSLLEVLKKKQPTHVLVAFDAFASDFRKALYPAYKAQREAQPEDITQSIPYIKTLLEALRIPFITQEGYEADDIIGTLVYQHASDQAEVYMMTPDKDFAQLVGKNRYLYKPGIGIKPTTVWGAEEVVKAWGIDRPEQVKDILGLWGDASDNIPGVPGIGQKTAQKLIRKFGSIENLLEHTHKLERKLAERIETHAEQALLSKKLAEICTTVPLSFDLKTSKYQSPDVEKLMSICNELGFRQLPKRILEQEHATQSLQTRLFVEESPAEPLPASPFATIASTPHQYHCIDSVVACEALIVKLQEEKMFAFDTETTSLDALQASLIGISIAYTPHEAYYINLKTPHAQALLDRLAPVFATREIKKVGQNLKYDLHVLQQHGIEVEANYFDTMVAHHLLYPEQAHNLNDMAASHLSYKAIEIATLIGKREKGSKQKCMSEVPIEKLTDYACEDADIALQLYQKFNKALKKEDLMYLFEKIEMPLLPVLVSMERTGVTLDSTALKEISAELQQEMKELVEGIYKETKEVFNVDSPKQLGYVLFEKLKLVDKPTKTKTGQYNTSQTTLMKLVGKHPVVDQVLAYRELKKLQSTYVDALPKLISIKDGRVHTSYHQAHVYTGRLSSSLPNLQNIPIRTARGRTIRKAFVACSPEYYLLAADYSQIELRLMAHFAHDQAMIQAFKTNKDIHAATAAKIFHTDFQDLTPAMRRQAKMVNFGIIYGISAFGLAQRLEISRQQASAIIKAYFSEFPGVKAYMERIIEEARTKGFVTTLQGRKRSFPHINSRNAILRGMEERAAINMPIQGSAAELIKQAMIAIDQYIKKTKLSVRMLMQVHDELVFEVHSSVVEEFTKQVKLLMQEAIRLAVPIVVNVGRGSNWLEAH